MAVPDERYAAPPKLATVVAAVESLAGLAWHTGAEVRIVKRVLS